ncbi:MAG: bleomycin resistance protein [Bdellovibrionales bacterium]
MSQFELSPAIPQLPSGDIEKTATFFETYLGFGIVAKMKDHNFLIVKRGAAEVHFWQAEDEEEARKLASQSSCYIRVKNIAAFFADLKSRKARFRYELKQMPWGMNEFQVDDVFGNAIKFGEPIK